MQHTEDAQLRSAITDLLDHTVERRIVSLGYYDGTTNGLLRAGTFAFRYDLVSWDEDQDQRVYCLAPVTLDAFDRAVEALQGLGEPTWPFWNPVWIFTTEERRIAAERILDTLVGTGEYNIAVFTKDLSRRVEEAVSLSEERRKLATKFKIDRVIQSFHLWSHRA